MYFKYLDIACSTPEVCENAGMVDMLKENMKWVNKNHKPYLLYIHAPWCPACQSMEPEWRAFMMKHTEPDVAPMLKDMLVVSLNDAAIELLRKGYPNTRLSKVIESFHQGFPALALVYRKDDEADTEVRVMRGARNKDQIELFVKAVREELGCLPPSKEE